MSTIQPIGNSPNAAPFAAAASASGVRHAVDDDRDGQRRQQSGQRREVRAHVAEREQPEQHDDRQRGDGADRNSWPRGS